jgi:peptidase M24-like protein
VATILLYGDRARHPAMRHEVPLEIIDPFLFVERDGQAFVLANGLVRAPRPGRGSQARRSTTSRPRSSRMAGFGRSARASAASGSRTASGSRSVTASGWTCHEAPRLGRGSGEPLVPGDVIAIEPGIEGLEGIGGVRFEDLLHITPDGCETLTRYPYDL